MKKIFLIGKANDVSKSLKEELEKHFRVQLSVDTSTNVDSMIKLIDPDLIVVLLIGIKDDYIFRLFETKYPNIPVVIVATKSELDIFKDVINSRQCSIIERPVENSVVINKVHSLLGLNEWESKDTAPKPKEDTKTVLVVDDDALVLRSIKGLLEEDYEVMLANSGMKAMTTIGKKRPDLILLDYEMPVCDGRQTLEMIKADDDIKDIPVVFLTGVNDREHIEAVLKLLPSGYLLKPVSKDKLLGTINKIIG